LLYNTTFTCKMCFPQIVLNQSCGSRKTDELRERNSNILPKNWNYNIIQREKEKESKINFLLQRKLEKNTLIKEIMY